MTELPATTSARFGHAARIRGRAAIGGSRSTWPRPCHRPVIVVLAHPARPVPLRQP
jgi:hypothetical protein